MTHPSPKSPNPISDPDPVEPRGFRRPLLSKPASPVKLVTLAFLSFHPNAMPWLSRANYAHELRASFFLPWAIAATEGGVIGFIVKKLYEGIVPETTLNYFAGALIAAPALANITSFLWAVLAHGKRKIPFITALQLGVLISIAMMAIAPRTPVGLYMLVAAAFSARILLAGIVTVRATIWGVNYPAHRAKLTGKLQTVTVTISSLIAMSLGIAMQYNENAYRIFIPIGGLIALAGVSSYARIRLRTERIILKNEQEQADSNNKTSILSGFKVLRDDKDYRAYQTCQLLLGFGNIMSWTPFVIIAKQQFDIGYFWGIMLTQVIPLMMMPFTIPFWAKLLDSVHIVQFRAFHSWIFIFSMGCALIAGQANLVGFLFAASVLRGIAFGGGALAWNLGHLQFVKPEKSQDYMSIHVTLTGLRGLTAPFAGVAIYNLLESHKQGSGSLVFAITLLITTTGALGFYYLYTQLKKPSNLLDSK